MINQLMLFTYSVYVPVITFVSLLLLKKVTLVLIKSEQYWNKTGASILLCFFCLA